MWMNVPEFLFGSRDTKLLYSTKVGERREDTRQLSRARGPLARWAIGPKTRPGEVHHYPDLAYATSPVGGSCGCPRRVGARHGNGARVGPGQ